MSDPRPTPSRPRRPAMLDPRAADELPGDSDPALRSEIAHTTAGAIVHRARASEDPEVVERLVRLVEAEGLDELAALWADSPAGTLPGALWRLYVLREWVRRDPATVAERYRSGAAAAQVPGVVAGVAMPPGPDDVRASPMRSCPACSPATSRSPSSGARPSAGCWPRVPRSTRTGSTTSIRTARGGSRAARPPSSARRRSSSSRPICGVAGGWTSPGIRGVLA